jgi:hypothetical protein
MRRVEWKEKLLLGVNLAPLTESDSPARTLLLKRGSRVD